MFEVLIALFLTNSAATVNLSTPPPPSETNSQSSINFNLNIPSERPVIQANSSLVFDLKEQSIIHQDQLNTKLPIASLTKLMTALIILQEHELDEVVTVAPEATQIQPNKMWLLTNEQITVEALLNGLLMQSANDAAVALAIHNAGSTQAFVNKMNTYANTLNLPNTHFTNPVGFDNANNYSTTYDLLRLTLEVIKHPIVLSITKQANHTVTDITQTHKHTLNSTNQLLNSPYQLIGLKTGTTPQAGACFISITEGKKPFLTILINSPNRFQETKILLDWALTNY